MLASGHIPSRFVDKDKQASQALQVNTSISLDTTASSPSCNAPTQSNGEGQAATNITSGVKSDSNAVNSPTLAEPIFISETQIEDIDFSDTSYEESYPKPNVSDVNIINKDTSFEEDFNQPESNTRDIVSPTLDWNPDDSYEKRLWARIVAEKNQRQRELEIIRREKKLLENEKQFRSEAVIEFDGCVHCQGLIADDNNKLTAATARHLRYLHAYSGRLERRLKSITQTLRRMRPFPSHPRHTTNTSHRFDKAATHPMKVSV